MSSHNSFSVSGSSPTKKKTKWDFRVEFHGAIILLLLLTSSGCACHGTSSGASGGVGPIKTSALITDINRYYPTVILEPRYLDGVLLQALTPVSTAHKSGGQHLRSRSRHDNDPNRAIAAGRKWRAADRRKRSRRHAH
jgi:hypothetical protein